MKAWETYKPTKATIFVHTTDMKVLKSKIAAYKILFEDAPAVFFTGTLKDSKGGDLIFAKSMDVRKIGRKRFQVCLDGIADSVWVTPFRPDAEFYFTLTF